jgi:hypothetical protein
MASTSAVDTSGGIYHSLWCVAVSGMGRHADTQTRGDTQCREVGSAPRRALGRDQLAGPNKGQTWLRFQFAATQLRHRAPFRIYA